MADAIVCTFLQEAGLASYEPLFKALNFSKENLLETNRVLLEEIIPNVEDRQKFIDKWEALYGVVAFDTVLQVVQAPAAGETEDLSVLNITKHSIKHALHNYITKPYLKSIIQRDKYTASILNLYEREAVLSDSNSNEICRTIIRELLMKNVDDWGNDHWEAASHNLAGPRSIFVGESAHTYYTPYVSKNDLPEGEDAIPTGGKLYHMYKNITGKINKNNGKVVSRKSTETAANVEQQNDPVDTALIKASETWLSQNETPLPEVLQHLKITRRSRRQKIRQNKGKDIEWVFEQCPIFKNPKYGAIAIKAEFQETFTAVPDAITQFTQFFHDLPEEVKNKNDGYVSDLESIADLDTFSEDHRLLARLSLLSYYFPPHKTSYSSKQDPLVVEDSGQKGKRKLTGTKVKSSKKPRKFSSADAEKSMIQYIEVPADIAAAKAAVLKLNKGKGTQPYIIGSGPSSLYSNKYFVVINDELLETESAADAIDVCFKAFQILDVHYPPASAHVWELIERGLYELQKEKKVPISGIAKSLKAVRSAKAERLTAASASTSSSVIASPATTSSKTPVSE